MTPLQTGSSSRALDSSPGPQDFGLNGALPVLDLDSILHNYEFFLYKIYPQF